MTDKIEIKDTIACALLVIFLGLFALLLPIIGTKEDEIVTELMNLNRVLSETNDEDGKLNCSRPLITLCSKMRDAVACGVSPFCIHCSWATSFNPNDANYGKCKRCQTAVQEGRINELLANFDFPKILRPICNLHIQTADEDSCIRNIAHYLSNRMEFWSIDSSKLSEVQTCSILGMCYSPFAITIPPNSQLLEDSSTKKDKSLESTFISHDSIRNAPGAKVVPFDFDPDVSNYERKFLPLFKSGSSKNICKFKEVNQNSSLNWWTRRIGEILIVTGVTIILGDFCLSKCSKLNSQGKVAEVVAAASEENQILNVVLDDRADQNNNDDDIYSDDSTASDDIYSDDSTASYSDDEDEDDDDSDYDTDRDDDNDSDFNLNEVILDNDEWEDVE